jgi:hypothetical protein
MQIYEWVDRFQNQERPTSLLLDTAAIEAQCIAAVNYYSGFADLMVHKELESDDPSRDIDTMTDVSVSEWAVIKPLFMLYVERETAFQLEAPRGMGIDVFGRSTSEISSEIMQVEAALPRLAFSHDIVTV